jgi:hypothetical protein
MKRITITLTDHEYNKYKRLAQADEEHILRTLNQKVKFPLSHTVERLALIGYGEVIKNVHIPATGIQE